MAVPTKAFVGFRPELTTLLCVHCPKRSRICLPPFLHGSIVPKPISVVPGRSLRMFSQPESRDELGLGQIRDALSDTLFPGT